jgi:hypothetical protein
MRDTRVLATTVLGAVVGGLAGYLLFTEPGRRVRRQIEPLLDDFERELLSFRDTAVKATTVASDSWKLINDAIREVADEVAPEPRFPGRQTSPF